MAKEEKKEKMDVQTMMEDYKIRANPGEPHKLLKRMAGSWIVQSKFWMDPNSPPVESTNTCEQQMVLGGRYLEQKYTGKMMEDVFSGIGFIGYDNQLKKYMLVWMDTMSTGIYFSEGEADSSGKTITLQGQSNDPVKGPMKFRSVTKIIDDNTLIMEMYSTDKSGKEEKMSEETYKRKE